MKKPPLLEVMPTTRMRQAQYIVQLESDLLTNNVDVKLLAEENAELADLCEYQLSVLANVAAQNAEMVRTSAENAVYFLQEKVALLERAEAAEAKLKEAGL